jgi:hypothetical protein
LKDGNGPVPRTIFKLMLVNKDAFGIEILTNAPMLKMQIRKMPVEINLKCGFKAKDVVRIL